jgi:hypothetical protein
LILKIFECAKDLPKNYKYILEQDIKHDALQLVTSLYRANKSDQKTAFETFLDEFELLKLEIRLCWQSFQLSIQAFSGIHVFKH